MTTATLIDRAPSKVAPASVDRQYLNAPDRLMLAAHETMRANGYAGFQCQAHVRLVGRVDLDLLRHGLSRLALRYPVVCSRLVQPPRGAPYWLFRPDEPVSLFETKLGIADHQAVWQYAEPLFERPAELDKTNPIEFHVLHLPDGRDVCLLRWWHVLMDGKSPEFVLEEINRLVAESNGSAQPSPVQDEFAAYLGHHPALHRLRCAARIVRNQIRPPFRSVTLMRPDARGWLVRPVRVRVHSIPAERSRALTERIRRLCGFPNLTAALVASAFRTVSRLTPRAKRRLVRFQTDVPLNLRPPRATAPIFRNFMSYIHLHARASELHDRDALTQLLNNRMRSQFRDGLDLGNAQMMAVMARHPRVLRWHIQERMRKRPLAVLFGYQGPVLPGLEHFCGTPIEQFSTLNSPLAPPGVMIQVNQYRGGLNLNITSISAAVSEELVTEFVQRLEEDLLAP